VILVVNPNPALDRVAVVRYRARATLRTQRFFVWPGGSGVHAGHVAHRLGASVVVVGFAAGATGGRLREVVEAAGIRGDWVAARGETRQTLSLLDADAGNLCDVVEPGPEVDLAGVGELEATVLGHLSDASIVIVSGSLPAGCPRGLPAWVIGQAGNRGLPTVVDLEGAVLEEAVAAGPWMIKPSYEEIARRLGHDPDASELLATCRVWHERGARNVCVSLGSLGLLWHSADGSRHLSAPVVPAWNTIGCGDTLVGATAATYETTGDLEHALRTGVAAAAANLALDAPGDCDPSVVDNLLPQVIVRQIDRASLAALLATNAPTAAS
jgi:tagatose 6-phosphate kinase